jgi:hypothetical protein
MVCLHPSVQVEPVAHGELAQEHIDVGAPVGGPPDLPAGALERVELRLGLESGVLHRVGDLAAASLCHGNVDIGELALQHGVRIRGPEGYSEASHGAHRSAVRLAQPDELACQRQERVPTRVHLRPHRLSVLTGVEPRQ